MATTILPPVNPIDTSLTVQQVQDSVYNWFQGAIGDRDHASDADDSTWYDGESAGYENVLMLLEGVIPPYEDLPVIKHLPKPKGSRLVGAALLAVAVASAFRKDLPADAH